MTAMQFSKMTDIIKTIFGDNTINYGEFEELWLTDEFKSTVEALFKPTSTQPKPKRARNPYIYFGMKNRARVKAENSDMNSKEITSELGRLWKACTDRSEYDELSAQDKIRYEQEMKTYTPPEGESKKDPNKPKGAKNPYIYFCVEMRPQVKQENPLMATNEITAELGRLWGECEDKSTYKALYERDKERYISDMRDYTPEGETDSNSNSKKDRSKPKRTRSAYIYFGMNMRKVIKDKNPDMASKDITREVARQWKECEDTSEYERLSEQDRLRFEEEMKTYTPPEGEVPVKIKTNKTTKPKRAKSAYIYFCQAMRPQVKDDNTDMDSKEITRELSRLWNELKKEEGDELERFKQMAEEAKQEFADNQESDHESDQEGTKSTKSTKSTNSVNEHIAQEESEDSAQEDDEKDSKLFELYYNFQKAGGFRPDIGDEKRRRKLKRKWDKMDTSDKLAYDEQ